MVEARYESAGTPRPVNKTQEVNSTHILRVHNVLTHILDALKCSV